MFISYLLGAFVIISFVIGLLFMLYFRDERDRAIFYWSISWLLYSAGLACVLFVTSYGYPNILQIKKVFDMFSILSLLFAIYKFSKIKIPGYWFRFSIYLSCWILIAMILDLDMPAVSIPIGLFELILAGMICYIILRYWGEHVRPIGRAFYSAIIIFLGIYKAYLALSEIGLNLDPDTYIGEALYTSLLNTCILIIYARNIKNNIKETEKQFEVIVESAQDAIFYFQFEPIPKFNYITPSIETITGFSPEVFYNDPHFILEVTDKSYFDIINSIFFANPEDVEATNEVFLMHNRKGDDIWVEMSISTIRGDSKTNAMGGIIRDITQMKSVQDELIESKRTRDLMLSYISHELKTPITSILGYASAIEDKTISSDEEREGAMEIIKNKALVLERMIIDLFQLSQLETNQFSFAFEQINGKELAEYVGRQIIPELKASPDIPYNIEIDRDKLTSIDVIADPVRISQVVTNIIVNAQRYTKKKNIIRIKFFLKENFIIEVIDKGVGIREEDIPYVFDRFFRIDNKGASSSQGRGLGLALSKEIVEAHGGNISLRSKYGKGSAFRLELPLYNE